MNNYRPFAETLGSTNSGGSLLDRVVGRALLAAALTSGCSLGQNNYNPENDASGSDSSDGAADSGSLSESGGSTDSSYVSTSDSSIESGSSDSSVESGSSDSPSTESGSADTGPGDSGGSEAEGEASREASADALTSTDGPAVGVGDIDQIYEAAAIPPNQIFGFAKKATCTPKCATPLTVGANCCAGTDQVTWIVSENGAHPAGWMQFNAISAPADANYDVTFWYHSGDADYYGDNDCGGQAFTQPNQGGCRPQVFTVNGTVMPGAYHFPAFPGSWATLYAATVSMPLKAGMNTIMIAPPPPRDSVDLDAIEILPPGKGHAPLIAPDTTDLIGH